MSILDPHEVNDELRDSEEEQQPATDASTPSEVSNEEESAVGDENENENDNQEGIPTEEETTEDAGETDA